MEDIWSPSRERTRSSRTKHWFNLGDLIRWSLFILAAFAIMESTKQTRSLVDSGILDSSPGGGKSNRLVNGESSPRPNDAPEETETTISTTTTPLRNVTTDVKSFGLEEIIAKAKTLAGDSHVFVQLFSAGYLEYTKNWVCNIRQFDGILEKVLFITSDRQSAAGLSAFDATLNVAYLRGFDNDDNDEDKSKRSFSFNDPQYKYYMVFRTNMILQMLQSDITVWLVESDAIWLKDPTERITSIKGDINVLNDKRDPDSLYCGGFQYLRPTKATISIWNKTLEVMERNTRDGDWEHSNEQNILDAFAKNATEGSMQVNFLPQDEFANGIFYHLDRKKHMPKAYVIHNNYIVGIDEKIQKAKGMGDWFLSKDGSSCHAWALK